MSPMYTCLPCSTYHTCPTCPNPRTSNTCVHPVDITYRALWCGAKWVNITWWASLTRPPNGPGMACASWVPPTPLARVNITRQAPYRYLCLPWLLLGCVTRAITGMWARVRAPGGEYIKKILEDGRVHWSTLYSPSRYPN